jgi:hypothetical protein
LDGFAFGVVIPRIAEMVRAAQEANYEFGPGRSDGDGSDGDGSDWDGSDWDVRTGTLESWMTRIDRMRAGC